MMTVRGVRCLVGALALITGGATAAAGPAAAANPTAPAQTVVISGNPPGDVNEPMPAGTGRIGGQAVDARTGRPVAGAAVTLALTGRAQVRVLSDETGRFLFSDLPKGQFTLTATRSGYSPGANGRVTPSGPAQPIDLADAERLTMLNVTLWPFSVIAGTVVDEAGEPVVGATVRAFKRTIVAGAPRFTQSGADATEDRGMFRIASLDAGTYVVGLPMTSYAWPASLEHHMLQGAHWPPTLLPEMTGSQSPIGDGIQITSGAAVVGQTSDRIAPVRTADGGFQMYGSQFYSGSVSAGDATPIVLAAGDERTGVNFALHANPAHDVSGTALGPTGPIGDIALTLRPMSNDVAHDVAVSVTDPRGRFTFLAVPPGQYILRAVSGPHGLPLPREIANRPGAPAAVPVWWGEQVISVDSNDVAGVSVTLRPGHRMRGRLQFKGATTPPSAQIRPMMVWLESANGQPGATMGIGRARVEADLTFLTAAVPGGPHVVRVSDPPAGWYLESVTHGSRDLSIDPIDMSEADVTAVAVVFTDRPAGLAGTVTAGTGGPEPASSIVVVFPTDPTGWGGRGAAPRRLQSARADRNGGYVIRSVPPGEYFVTAIDATLAGDWQQRALLETLARSATRVDIRAGEIRQLQVSTARAPSSVR